ncbi:MAG: hypothetical protein ACRDZ5_01810 [Acidimicrobiales bacterium]
MLVAPHVAANGWSLTCLEPDASMASLCRHNLEKSSGVEVLEVGFEEYVDGPRAHDPPALVFAAQSWHWVDPTRRCDLVADLLAPGGTLGLIWNVSHQPDADLQAQIDAAYGKAVPDNLPWQPPRCGRGPSAGSAGSDRSAGRRLLGEDMVDYRRELDASGRFGQVELAERPWTRRYTTSQWLSLLSTHSNHRLLDEETLAAVLERIGAVVDKTGGELTIEYTAVALLTRSLVPA